jgi:hypothetical protein
MKSPCIHGWYSWTQQSSSAADPSQLPTVQSLSMPANITHMTCRLMSSTCWQSPCHRSENSWCPTAGRCWRECELMPHQRCQLDDLQKEGKGEWNYCINFVADWTGYDRRFEILYAVSLGKQFLVFWRITAIFLDCLMKALRSVKIFGNGYPLTQCSFAEGSNLDWISWPFAYR